MKKLIICLVTALLFSVFAGCHKMHDLDDVTTAGQGASTALDATAGTSGSLDTNAIPEADPIVTEPMENDDPISSEKDPDAVYTVLEYDFSNSVSGAMHALEYWGWAETEDLSQNAAPTMAIRFDGKDLQGTFSLAAKGVGNNYSEYFYKTPDGRSFAVDEDGRLTYCNWNISENGKGTLSQEECLEIAKDFFCTMVNIDEYRVENICEERDGEYRFRFVKYIGEFMTADSAYIWVMDTGELRAFRTWMLGRVPMDTPVAFDHDEVMVALYEKLDTIYADVVDEFERIEYEFYPFEVTILEDGEVALHCVVDVDCIGENGLHQPEKVGFVVRRN